MTATAAQGSGGWWGKWKKAVEADAEGGPRGLRGSEDRKEKTEFEFCGECWWPGRVEGAIGAIGANSGGTGSSRILYGGSYR